MTTRLDPMASSAPTEVPDQPDVSTVVAHAKRSDSIDDQTVQLTPEPQAVSTALRPQPINKRLQELLTSFTEQISMSLAAAAAPADRESSFGLVPKHLVDLSMFTNSSSILNMDRSSVTAVVDKLSDEDCVDDVFEELVCESKGNEKQSACERQAGDGKEEMSEVKLKVNASKDGTRNIVADLTEVEFCDEQISARSSTVDSYRGSAGDRVSALGTELLTKLFQRHSLDLSVVASSPFDSFARSQSSQSPALMTVAVDASAGDSNAKTPLSADGIKENRIDSLFLREGSRLSDFGDFDFDEGADEGSFVAAGAALGMFEKDEEVLKIENAFIIPSQAEDKQDCLLQQSWLENNQDITRPSWISSAEDDRSSRVSIGAFLRAKTEDLGTLGDSTVDSMAGMECGSPPREFEPLSAMQFVDPEDACDASTVSVLNYISRIHAETSNSFDPDVMMAKLMKMADERKADKRGLSRRVSRRTSIRADPSGASDLTNHSEQTASVKNVETDPVSNWVALRSAKKLDGDLQSSVMESSPLLQQHLMDVTDGYLGNISQWNGNVKQASQNLAAPLITLHLLHKSSLSRRPSLEVPTNLIFSEPCATGSSLTQCLSIQNPLTIWLEGSAELLYLKCNGRPHNFGDLGMSQIFTFDARYTLGPEVSKQISVKFSPTCEGHWMAQIRISCRQISCVEWHVVSVVSLEADAERPRVDVHPNDILDFGRLPEDSLSVRTVEVVNRGNARVPIRLIIEGEQHLGQRFYFAAVSEPSDLMSDQVTSPSEMFCTLKGNKSINIHLKTPSISAHEDEVQVLRTKLRIDLDSSTSGVTFATVLLRAMVGVMKLYIPQDVEPIPLQPSYDLPIQNRGPISVQIELGSEHPAYVSVVPSALLLEPRQRTFVRLTYRAAGHSTSPLKSQLKIRVQPEGPLYEMHLVGLSQANTGPSRQPRCPPLLSSDMRNVFFGTVPIGQTFEKTLTLHNASAVNSLNFKFYVMSDNNNNNPGRTPTPFGVVLQSASSGLQSIRSISSASLRPNGKMSVVVYYSPTTIRADLAALVIKPLEDAHSDAGRGRVKFTLPLAGYGGTSNVVWDGVDQKKAVADDCDWVINRKAPNGEFVLTARNLGQRPAFVKVMPSQVPTLASESATSSMSLPLLSVRPSQFVLFDGAVQHVTVTVDLSLYTPLPAFYLGLFAGDEILRQRFGAYCRSTSAIGDSSRQQLERLLLDDRFLNEVPAAEVMSVERWPPSRSDWQLFVSNLTTKWVAVLPSLFGTSASADVPYREEPSRILMPLMAEHTFNETVNSSKICGPTSPPTREHVTLKVDKEVIKFPTTICGSSSVLKVTIRNPSLKNEKVEVLAPAAPFGVKNSLVTLKQRHYLSLPVHFRPQHVGTYSSKLVLRTADNTELTIHLIGDAVQT